MKSEIERAHELSLRIPRHQNGMKVGEATSERLRQVDLILTSMNPDHATMDFLEREIALAQLAWEKQKAYLSMQGIGGHR